MARHHGTPPAGAARNAGIPGFILCYAASIMMYLVAILVPPLAMFLSGKPFQAVICLVLQATVIGWLPAAIWAALVVNSRQADKRNEKLIREMRKAQQSPGR